MQCAICGGTIPFAGAVCPHCESSTQKLILFLFALVGLITGYSGHGIIGAILGGTIAGAVGKFLLSKIGTRKVILGGGVLVGFSVVVGLAINSQQTTQPSAKSESQTSQVAVESAPAIPPIRQIVAHFPTTAYPLSAKRAFESIVRHFEGCASGWEQAGHIAVEDGGIHKVDAYELAWQDCTDSISGDIDIIKKAKMDDGAKTRLLVLADIAEHFREEGANKAMHAKDWFEDLYLERANSEIREFTDTGKETTQKWLNASKSLDDYRKSKEW